MTLATTDKSRRLSSPGAANHVRNYGFTSYALCGLSSRQVEVNFQYLREAQ